MHTIDALGVVVALLCAVFGCSLAVTNRRDKTDEDSEMLPLFALGVLVATLGVAGAMMTAFSGSMDARSDKVVEIVEAKYGITVDSHNGVGEVGSGEEWHLSDASQWFIDGTYHYCRVEYEPTFRPSKMNPDDVSLSCTQLGGEPADFTAKPA